MSRRIVVIDGHPDPAGGHLVDTLCQAYADGARKAGHQVSVLRVATLDFPLLRTTAEFRHGTPPPDIADAQSRIAACDHLVIVHPLWLGTTPALLEGFFEQVFRPGFARAMEKDGEMGRALLTGISAHVVVTMAMPSFVYRWFFLAHGTRRLVRNVLKFVGIAPVRATYFGNAEGGEPARHDAWRRQMRKAGRRAR